MQPSTFPLISSNSPTLSTPSTSCSKKSVHAIALAVFTGFIVLNALALASIVVVPIHAAALAVILAISAIAWLRLLCCIKPCVSHPPSHIVPLIPSTTSSLSQPSLTNVANPSTFVTSLTQETSILQEKDFDALLAWAEHDDMGSSMEFVVQPASDPLNKTEQFVLHLWTGNLYPEMNQVASNQMQNAIISRINATAIHALSKLPPYPDQQNLIRGAHFKINEGHSFFPKGNVHILDRFMSTADSVGHFDYNTIFHVTGKTGKGIQKYSKLKKENEVLFPPGTKFLVTSVQWRTAPDQKSHIHLVEV